MSISPASYTEFVVLPFLIAALLLAAPPLARHGESGFSSPHGETGTRADRAQVYSLQGADCASCADAIKSELKKVKGIRKVDFDKHAVELSIRMDDGVPDQTVLDAIARAGEGFKGLVGGGQGAYLPVPEFPPGTDVQILTRNGSAVGPLPKLAVPGKYTVFDVFAEWCGPCRLVDDIVLTPKGKRIDVAGADFETLDKALQTP